MNIIAVVNQKGGSTKTTTVLGLASALRAAEKRVLVVDLDPQCNASEALGVRYPVDGHTSAELLARDVPGSAWEAIRTSSWSGVDVIASDLDLADIDASMQLGLEFRLRSSLDSEKIRTTYDVILIDCPPSVGKLVSNALIAADLALIASEPSFMANRGVAKVMTSIEEIRRHYNHDLTLAGVLLGRVPPSTHREAAFRAGEIREALGRLVFDLSVPQRAAVFEAVGDGKPIHDVRPAPLDVLAAFDDVAYRILEKVAR